MSIYTDMIAEIEQRGSCRGDLVDLHGRVCLIGAYAYAKGMDPRLPGFDVNWPYRLAAKELTHLKDTILALEPSMNQDFDLLTDSMVLWKWNDRIAHGDKEKMIAMLKLADAK